MIKILDAYMGYGKSTKIIKQINDNPQKKYIVIVPYLTECERYKNQCVNVKFYEPDCNNEKGSKIEGIKHLLKSGLNIISTHSCFKGLSIEDAKLLKEYTLILDEELDVINELKIDKGDMRLLLEKNVISVNEETKKISWDYRIDEKFNDKFEEIKSACDLDMIYLINGNVLMWEYPPVIFKSFEDVKVLTYQFEGTLMNLYFIKHDIEYKIHKIDDTEFKAQAKKLMNIYQGKRVLEYKNKNSLSKSNITKMSTENARKLALKTKNYLMKDVKSKAKENMWTTFKSTKNKLKGEGYSKNFVYCTCRGTNDYAHIKTCLYLMNFFLPPELITYFEINKIKVDLDKIAENYLIQWLWRSAIRNNEPINVFIPSKRMRDLLINWLG